MTSLTSEHAQNTALLVELEGEFPNISKLPLQLPAFPEAALRKLVNLIKFSIPVHTFQQDLLALYEQISEAYHTYIFRHSLQPQPESIRKNDDSFTSIPNITAENTQKKAPQRTRMNYLDLARFINSYQPDMEHLVSQDVIRQGQRFAEWQVKEITVPAIKETPKKMRDRGERYEKYEKQEIKLARQKVTKLETVSIKIGKNISREIYEMKSLLITRARSNRLLGDQILTDLQKVGVEINYILNRLTEEYFQEFLVDLRPYATHEYYSFVLAEKIIQKVLEEHNYTKLYCKLARELRNIKVRIEDGSVQFKVIFIQKLQNYFYKFIRKGEWSEKEELYKKQLLGLNYFLGELIHSKFLSKQVFPDIFYELITTYIQQYRLYQNNKAFYYHQTYIECIIKVIEAMGSKYDQLIKKKSSINVSSICDILLSYEYSKNNQYSTITDFIEVLREINRRLPSQRFKIAFLLEDFRCSKAIKQVQQSDQNNEFQIVKGVLAIDHDNGHDLLNIPKMISKCNPHIIMKDYYFQFAEGNAKRVNRNVETFKLFMHLPGVYEAALQVLKDNLEGLYLIDCDFPYLAEGLAKIMKQVCDYHRWEWKGLGLFDDDEDIMQFIERIQQKYFKMIVQD